MGLISLIEHIAQVLTGSTASKVAADEVKAWSPWLAARLTRYAVKRLPEADRERYAEEWNSHVADTPGSVGKVCVACGFLFAARKIRSANVMPLGIRFAYSVFLISAWPFLKATPPIVRLNSRYASPSSAPWYVKTLSWLCLRPLVFQLTWANRLMEKGGVPRP